MLKAKFHMTREQSITLAKRNVIDYIWKSANLEGIMITYPETEALFKGINVQRISVDKIVLINNLKHAWTFLLETIDYPIDYGYICKINQVIGANLYYNAGFIRTTLVSTGGTNWKPDLPIESQIRKELEEVFAIESSTDKALTLMGYLMRKQMFIDGNKRTATLVANQILIASGGGVISVPQEKIQDFSKVTKNFYETNEIEEFKMYIYNECLEGGIFQETNEGLYEKQQKLFETYDKLQEEHRKYSINRYLK
jgi:prophage maintenance system killer protein